MENKKAQVVGNAGFWLCVPPVISLVIGFVIHMLIPVLNTFAIAMLAYAIFTFWIIGRYHQWYVRGPLTLVNFAMFIGFGYVQWGYLLPNLPQWSSWVGAILIAVIWVTIFVLRMRKLGNKQHHATHEDTQSLIQKIKDGGMDVGLQERLISIVKVATSKGDLTVDTAELVRQLGDEAKRKDRDSRVAAANALMEALRIGIFDEADKPQVKKQIQTLLNVPDVVQTGQTSVSTKSTAPNKRVATIDWGHKGGTR